MALPLLLAELAALGERVRAVGVVAEVALGRSVSGRTSKPAHAASSGGGGGGGGGGDASDSATGGAAPPAAAAARRPAAAAAT